MTSWAVILAGGVGRRFGAPTPKQLSVLGDRTVLEHSVAAFVGHAAIDRVLVVAPADRLEEIGGLVEGDALVVPGGSERADSTRCAVEALADAGAGPDDLVLVHDAARPLVSATVIGEVVEALADHAAVATLVDTPDTIVRIDPQSGAIVDVLPRAELRRHQTPQGFRLGLLAEVHQRAVVDAASVATDDCSLVQRYRPDIPVGVVPGDPSNLKITDATDLAIASALLAARSD